MNNVSVFARLYRFLLAGVVIVTAGCQPNQTSELVQPQPKTVNKASLRLASNETLQPVGNGRFYLVNRRSGKMLDVSGFQTADGSNTIQYGGTGGHNQQWTLTQVSSGYYSIVGLQSGKSLQAKQGSTANGAIADISTNNSSNNQQWQFIPTSEGYYRIVNRNSGKSLDVSGQSIDDLADVILWDYWGGENQQWALLTTQAGGQVGWTLTTADVPTDARERITAAMNDACARYNAISKWPARTLTVEYNPGVQTADGNTNGNIRFGSNPSFQNTRVAMHEISHTWGVGISGGWYANTSTGPFTGQTAVALFKTLDGPDAVINTGGHHFWPYGLNYDNEWSESNAYRHVKMVFAMRADGM